MLEVNANDIGGKLQDYVYMGDNEQLRCIVMGYGMMYNSSQDANLTYHRAPNGDFVYTAVRHIRAGEELFIDYGESWWASAPDRGYKHPRGYGQWMPPQEPHGYLQMAVAGPMPPSMYHPHMQPAMHYY
jgi:hypothetical protein